MGESQRGGVTGVGLKGLSTAAVFGAMFLEIWIKDKDIKQKEKI